MICGFGIQGYALAIDGLAAMTGQEEQALSMAPKDKSTAEGKPAIDKELIRELAKLLDETGLTEIEIERDGLRVRVGRGGAVTHVAAPVAAAAAGAAPPRRRRARRSRPSIPAPSPRRWSAPPIAGRRPAPRRSSISAARSWPARRC